MTRAHAGRAHVRWALAALFVASSLASLGSFLDDEVLQATALENLHDGHDLVHDAPPHLWQITDDVAFEPREVPGSGAHPHGVPTPPAASGLLTLLAAPVAVVLGLVDLVLPVHLPLLGAWAVLGHHATGWAVDAAATLRGRTVDWTRPVGRLPCPRVLLGWAWTLLWAWGAWSLPPIDLAHWGSLVALQLTNLLLFAATAGFIHALGASVYRAWGPLAVLLWLASPALFWGYGAKYHAAQALLAVAVAWLYQRGTTEGREGWVLGAAALAGLAVLSNDMGVALVVGLGIVHLWNLLRRRVPWGLRHAVTFGAATLAGLAPWMMWATATRTAPWSRVVGPTSAVEAQHGFGGAADLLRNVWAAHVDASWFEGEPAAVWLIAPWAVLAVVGLLRPRKPAGLAVLAVHAVLVWLAVGPRLPEQGSGFDARFLAGLWPAYALLAAWAIRDAVAWDRTAVRRLLGTAGAGTFLALAVLATFAALGLWLGDPDGRQATRYHLLVGRVVLSAVVLHLAVAVPWRPARRVAAPMLGIALVPAVLWCIDAVLVHHRRLPGIDGAPDAAWLTPLGRLLWDLAWDLLVPCEGRYLCGVR